MYSPIPHKLNATKKKIGEKLPKLKETPVHRKSIPKKSKIDPKCENRRIADFQDMLEFF